MMVLISSTLFICLGILHYIRYKRRNPNSTFIDYLMEG